MRRSYVVVAAATMAGVVLGATVLRTPVASAAAAAASAVNVFVTNDSAHPVIVQQQGTASVNVANFPSSQGVTISNTSVPVTGDAGAAAGRVIMLQSTDFTLSLPNNVAHEWSADDTADCRSVSAYLYASDQLTLKFSPSFFTNVPGTEMGGSDVITTDGTHYSGWMALQGDVPITAGAFGVALELPGNISSVTVHQLFLWCSR